MPFQKELGGIMITGVTAGTIVKKPQTSASKTRIQSTTSSNTPNVFDVPRTR
jgi:hypothetical protein